MTSKIDPQEFSLHINWRVFFRKFIVLSPMLVIFALFIGGYIFTFRVFSNDYLLGRFIENTEYSRGILYLSEKSDDSDLVRQLYDFFGEYQNDNTIMPIFFDNLPKGLRILSQEHKEIQESVFTNILLPGLVLYNQKILNERSIILELYNRILVQSVTQEDFDTIEALSIQYGVRLQGESFWDYFVALEELILRVDIMPISVIIANAAYVTNWGADTNLTSQNLLFSENIKTSSLGGGDVFEGVSKLVALEFPDLHSSILHYYKVVNTSDDYKRFRVLRQRLRQENNRLYYDHVLTYLGYTPNIEQSYINALRRIVISSGLNKIDNMEISFNKDYPKYAFKIIERFDVFDF